MHILDEDEEVELLSLKIEGAQGGERVKGEAVKTGDIFLQGGCTGGLHFCS